MLTAKGERADEIEGFTCGADDNTEILPHSALIGDSGEPVRYMSVLGEDHK